MSLYVCHMPHACLSHIILRSCRLDWYQTPVFLALTVLLLLGLRLLYLANSGSFDQLLVLGCLQQIAVHSADTPHLLVSVLQTSDTWSSQYKVLRHQHCCYSFDSSFNPQSVYCNSEMSSLNWKSNPYTGNLNSEAPGDSKNAFLHCGDLYTSTTPWVCSVHQPTTQSTYIPCL